MHRIYAEEPALELLDVGIIDIIRTPPEGETIHSGIPWKRLSSVAIQAAYLDASATHEPIQLHTLVAKFRDNRPRSIPFLLRQEEDMNFCIATEAGVAAGMVAVPPEASGIIREKLFLSLDTLIHSD